MDEQMNKRPSLQFYPGDWWRANDIKGCSMSTQGVWFNLLLAMWDAPERGKLEMNIASICRVIGAKTREVNLFFGENEQHKFADVTECNGNVTIINRRMYAEYLSQEGTKKRVQEFRKRQCNANVTGKKSEICNANVTPPSSSSTSSSYIYTLSQVKNVGISIGISEQQAEEWYHHFAAQGFVFGNNLPIVNLREALVRWRNNQYKFEKRRENATNRTKNSSSQRSQTRRNSFADQESKYGKTIE